MVRCYRNNCRKQWDNSCLFSWDVEYFDDKCNFEPTRDSLETGIAEPSSSASIGFLSRELETSTANGTVVQITTAITGLYG